MVGLTPEQGFVSYSNYQMWCASGFYNGALLFLLYSNDLSDWLKSTALNIYMNAMLKTFSMMEVIKLGLHVRFFSRAGGAADQISSHCRRE